MINVKEIILLDEVELDLIKGEKFYNRIREGIGGYFYDCLINDLKSLKQYAGIHSKHNGFYRMLSKRFPYAIYYDIKQDVVYVVAVISMRRNPKRIQSLLKKRM